VVKAATDWERRAGVDSLAAAVEQARTELYAARGALGTNKLQSIADASAILEIVRANLKQFGEIMEWETAALSNASKFLSRTTAGAVA
jgi:hypothetical protein